MFETKSLYNPSGTAIYVNGIFVLSGEEAPYGERGMVFSLGGVEGSPALLVRSSGFETDAEDWFRHEVTGSSATRTDGSGFHSGRYKVATGECVRFAQLLPGASLAGQVSGPAMVCGTFQCDFDGRLSITVNQGGPDLEDIYELVLVDGVYLPQQH